MLPSSKRKKVRPPASGFRICQGCISAGDTLDEAMQNAAEALELWAKGMIESGQTIPPPRKLADLKADREVAHELARYMVALIPLPEGLRQHAAE
jgi:hypothetical protein